MVDFETVAKVGDIPDGQGIAYAVNGRMVAVFNLGGTYEAIDDFCPHMGASLAGGYVEDGIVICPWHAWRFKTCDGTWCDNPTVKIDSFEVRVEGDEIQVLVPDKQIPIGQGMPPADRQDAADRQDDRAEDRQADPEEDPEEDRDEDSKSAE